MYTRDERLCISGVEVLLAFLLEGKKKCTTSDLLLPFPLFQMLVAVSPLQVFPGSPPEGGAALFGLWSRLWLGLPSRAPCSQRCSLRKLGAKMMTDGGFSLLPGCE